MAKYRLNADDRHTLMTMAMKKINLKPEQDALAAARAALAPIVWAAVRSKFPAEDMLVLQKYEAVIQDYCVRLQLTHGGVVQFVFDHDHPAPLRPRSYSCRDQIFLLDEKGTALFHEMDRADEALKKTRDGYRKDFAALINGSRYLEQVEEVWPGAGALRASVKTNVPSVLNAETVSRLKEILTREEA